MTFQVADRPRVAIVGAGIAGLSSAMFLKAKGVDVTVFERKPEPGGLARSFTWHGFPCDFAAHRLFSRDGETLQQLLKLIPMGRHVRRSKIYLGGHWLRDPLDVVELLAHLPPTEWARVGLTYFLRPRSLVEDSFESYVLRRYGHRLYTLFFQPYTEKLFGIPGKEISVIWAQRKVRLASPLDVLRESTKTKFSYFYYPLRHGYGAIADALHQQVKDSVILATTVLAIETEAGRITGVRYRTGDQVQTVPVDYLISTLPITLTSKMLGRSFPLRFRKVDAVYLWLNRRYLSDYHWTYYMDADVAINRMVEFKNMSPLDVPEDTTVVCAEVTQDHDDPAGKVMADLVRIGLIQQQEVLDVKVVREDFAYPVYDVDYVTKIQEAHAHLALFQNLQIVGRAAEFEHREVDDNFSMARVVATEILKQISAARSIVELQVQEPAMSTDPSVYVVILAFNNVADTLECLATIQANTYSNKHIVLVDNGSSDDTVDQVRTRFPFVHIIENGRNLGVPAGFNVGFEYALRQDSDYVLMLNNDTAADPNFIEALVAEAESDHDIGVVMPKVVYYDHPDRLWAMGGRYRRFPPAIVMRDTRHGDVGDLPEYLEFAPSCALLICRKTFECAGLFDPGYLYYFDDWDFSKRVRTYGLKIRYQPEAVLRHKVSATVKKEGRSAKFWTTFAASSVRYYRRHGRPAWLSVLIHVGFLFLREIIFNGNWQCRQSFWEGVRAEYRRPLGPIPPAPEIDQTAGPGRPEQGTADV